MGCGGLNTPEMRSSLKKWRYCSPHSLTAERDVNSVMLVTATGKECTEIHKNSVEAPVRERKFVRMSIPFTLLANTLYSLVHFARRGLFRVTGVTGQHAA